MIDLNELEEAINRCAFDGDVLGLSKAECRDLLTRLRRAEKDAARYRWLREQHDQEDDTVSIFINDEQHGAGHLDAQIDEAMQCK